MCVEKALACANTMIGKRAIFFSQLENDVGIFKNEKKVQIVAQMNCFMARIPS